MAQYRKDLGTFPSQTANTFEVVMIADAFGNPTSPGGGGSISTVNSTSANLASGATFTGEWEDVSSYDSLVVAAKTDQDGRLIVQFSPDGTNIDSALTRYYRTNQIEAPHRFTITRQYARILFTNDSAVDQTFLRLQTMYGSKSDLNIPTDSVMAQDFDALSVRPTHFMYEASLGRRQGVTVWDKFGYNADIDISDGEETIWANNSGRIVILDSPATLNISSTSIYDNVSANGAQTAIIYGVDANHKAIQESVNLNGTQIVQTANTYYGVNRISITRAGADKDNAGTIYARANGTNSVQAIVPVGEAVTQQCVFFTQAGHVSLADWMLININKVSGGGSPVVTIRGRVYNFDTNVVQEVFRHTIDTNVENTVELKPPHPWRLPANSAFELTGVTTADNTLVNIRFSLVEYRNVDT